MNIQPRWLLLITLLLTACGGGGSDSAPVTPPPPPPPPPVETVDAGVYRASFTDGFSGFLLVTPTGEAIVAARHVGVGTWSYTNGTAQISLTGPEFARDDNGSEGPAALGAVRTQELNVTKTGDRWSGEGNTLEPHSVPESDLFHLARLWATGRPFVLNGMSEQYRIDLTTFGDGTINGTDVTGCIFDGHISRASGVVLYDITLTVQACGPSSFYIRNGTYAGHGFMEGTGDPVSDPFRLALILLSDDGLAGIFVYLQEIPQQ